MRKSKNIIVAITGTFIVACCAALYLKGAIGNPYKYRRYSNLNNYNETYFSSANEIWPDDINNIDAVKNFFLGEYTVDTQTYYGYMSINYSKEEFDKEMERLKKINSTDYVGVYGAKAIDKYDLLAIKALEEHHSMNGFTYALQTDASTITYVELWFCGDWIRSDVFDAIPKEYLPEGLNMNVY